MPKLYHINHNGVAPCGAKKGNCPYKGEDGSPENHFEDPVEAMRVFESRLENEYGTTNSVSKKDTLEPESRRLAANGGTPKQIRDALRRENPTWGNPQVHTVQRRMTEELESKKEPQDLTKALSDSIAHEQTKKEAVSPAVIQVLHGRMKESDEKVKNVYAEIRKSEFEKKDYDKKFGEAEGRAYHIGDYAKIINTPAPAGRQTFYRASDEQKKKSEELHEKLKEAIQESKDAQTAVEKAGLGYTIPDDGPVLRVRTQAQKWLLENELKGQISDGMWENASPNDHWKVWSQAKVVVDPKNVGRNFSARKDNYSLNSKSLLEVVGERMKDEVKKETGEDYDDATMAKDLRELKVIFKTERDRLNN